MKRILLTGVVAMVGVMVLTDTAEARRRLFGGRRGNDCNNCQACGPCQTDCGNCQSGCGNCQNGCAPTFTQTMPAPTAQADVTPPGQSSATTFYRGPNAAPPQQPATATPSAPAAPGANTLRTPPAPAAPAAPAAPRTNLGGGANLPKN
jgi:hypothetical protein